jgi:hypothetical protein
VNNERPASSFGLQYSPYSCTVQFGPLHVHIAALEYVFLVQGTVQYSMTYLPVLLAPIAMACATTGSTVNYCTVPCSTPP